MAITTTWIDGLTSDYEVKNYLYVKKNPLLTECYSRLVTPLGSWIIDTTYGSRFPQWLNTRSQLTANLAVQELDRIYSPIVLQQRASKIISQVDLSSPGFIKILVSITDNASNSLILNVSLGR